MTVTVTTAIAVLAGILAVLALLILIFLIVLVLRKPQDLSSVLSPVQGLMQSVGHVETELRGLSERVSTVERNESQVSQAVGALSAKLAETGAVTEGLAATASAIHTGLTSAQETLAALHMHTTARQEVEQQSAESLRRLEAVIAGTKTKGTAGENIIDLVFAQLPPQWQVRDFQVGNRTVEFGLRLPNNLILPIDSKWTATNLLEDFLACEDVDRRQVLKSQVERAVVAKAKEVRKYIDPSVTVNFGIATIPDAIFDLCSAVQVEALQLNVVLLSYSMFVPYLLLTFQTILKSTHDIDLQKLAGYLDTAQGTIRSLQEELEGRMSRAVTMLENSRDEMRVHLGKVDTALTAVQLGKGGQAAPQLPFPTAGEAA
jgi:DNA recombination protein RmuC